MRPNRRSRRSNRSGFGICSKTYVKYQVLHFPINFHCIWAIISGFIYIANMCSRRGSGPKIRSTVAQIRQNRFCSEWFCFHPATIANDFQRKNFKFIEWIWNSAVGSESPESAIAPIQIRSDSEFDNATLLSSYMCTTYLNFKRLRPVLQVLHDLENPLQYLRNRIRT